VIISAFPAIFADFRGKRYSLLWRGSRDGFGARDFHGRCDGHANTLTVILDTEGNIFGGFTPVEWESRRPISESDWSNCNLADPSLKSFLFTLTNPHKIPSRRFALMAEAKGRAIQADGNDGPNFNDIYISNKCNASTDNASVVGHSVYTNDTGLDGRMVFTGSYNFQVKEIEVFEITN
jgi:hypothetical protein